jgi:similar to stage IV sporulation protein
MYAPYFREYTARRRERRFAGETRKRLGFSVFVSKYKARLGLFVGGLFGIFLLVFSSLFVWDITVSGNETIPERVILDAMEENGLKLGAFIPSLDTERIEGVVILEVDGISFVSVNLRGTVANVELRERADNTEIVDIESPSNLVASRDGQISALEITGGVSKVRLGEIVKKGDLLASGVIDSAALGYRLVRARGSISARTTMTYQAEIPLEITEMVYTGRTTTYYSIKFFSKIINFFRKDNISEESCDRIEEERRIYLFGKIKLPIFTVKTTYAEYEMKTRTMTEAEALQKAKDSLREKSENDLADAEILARHTDIFCNGETLFLTEKVECIVDIAEEVKIGTEAD